MNTDVRLSFVRHRDKDVATHEGELWTRLEFKLNFPIYPPHIHPGKGTISEC